MSAALHVRCAPALAPRCGARARRCAPRAARAAAPSPRDAAPAPASGTEALARRAVLSGSAGAALLAALPVPRSRAEAGPPPLDGLGRTVVLTGCNTGIGYDAAGKLAARGFNVIMACRTAAKADAAAASLRAAAEASGAPLAGALEPAECDLASLASVRAFAASFAASGRPLHLLCLNAGLQYSGDNAVRRTADGFEVTVGTNHLGHFLLANLLLPSLQKAGAARVVVTASEVHDPASPGGAVGPGATLGDLAGMATQGAGFEMIDGGPYNADKAYKDSKLCNVLFARELARRLKASGSPVEVAAFGPGLITRTGFFRNQNPVFTALFDFATNDLFHVAESVSGGGDCLVAMATRPDLPSGAYYNNDLDGAGGHRFEAQAPSKEAQNDEEAARLWRLSAQLVGLPA